MKILLKNLFLPFPLIPEEKDGLILISIYFHSNLGILLFVNYQIHFFKMVHNAIIVYSKTSSI